MRSEATEAGNPGGRERSGAGRWSWFPRRAAARRAQLRRAALEALEARQLLATVPAPIVVERELMPSGGTGDDAAQPSNESDPSIAVDRYNPDHLVAVWTRFDPDFSGANPPDILVEAAYSIDAGRTWQSLNLGGNLGDPNTTNPRIPYDRAIDPSVAFDAEGNVYILQAQQNAGGTSGALVLDKFDLSGGAPVAVFTNQVVYQWSPGSDGARDASLAVDDGPATFTDPDTGATQDNPFSGNVYVAWSSVDIAPANLSPIPDTYNPNRILLISSSDGGETFGGWSVLNDGGNNGLQRNSRPRIAVSQGTVDGRIAPGRVTVVWDDFGSGRNASPPLDFIEADRPGAGVNANFLSAGGLITDAFDPGGGAAHVTTPTEFPVNVDITDPRFLTLTDLDVRLVVTHPNTQELLVELVPPTGSGLPTVTLVRNQTNAAGTQNQAIGVSGGNLGILNGVQIGTTFNDQATRNIVDFTNAPPARGAGAPFIGHFRPEVGSLSVYNGATAAQLGGTWTIRITDHRAGPAGQRAALEEAELGFRSGLAPTFDATVAVTRVIGSITDGFARNTAINPTGVGPGAMVAQDNTLGSFSPFQGRLYVTYVDRDNIQDNPDDNTDIYLVTSDDGGLSWSLPVQVNDDQAIEDGFSEGRDIGTTSLTGRAQFQPRVAVDQTTGTVALAWYDARHDAARARVATYLTASIDGGGTFSEQVFANPPRNVVDAITGDVVVTEPIPDNQSTGNGNREGTFGFGDNQGLAFHGGRIYPIWSSNINGGTDPNSLNRLDIAAAVLTVTAGPRVVDSTMGVVGLTDQFGNIIDPINNATTPDGTPIVSGFEVVFDRPVDPASFRPEDVRVFFRDATPGNASGGPVPVLDVVPLASRPGDPDFLYNPVVGPGPADQQFGNTRFRVVVAPRSAVGTYSYMLGPDITDRIRGPQITTFEISPVGPRQALASTDVPIPIADLSTITSDLVVAGFPANQVVEDLNVVVTIDHTFSADLVLTLIAPNGARITLAQNRGFGFDNAYSGTIFDDEAAVAIGTTFPPFIGSFRPEEPLDQFDGTALNGTWQLQVADVIGSDAGVLRSWSLDVQPGVVTGATTTGSDGNPMDQDADGTTGELPATGVGPGDVYAAPRPTATTGFQFDPATFFSGPYDLATLPLILSGPRVISSRVPGTPATGDNLVLDRPVSALDVTFDRDMAIDSFTGADVLRITGPAGELIKPTPFVGLDPRNPGDDRAIPDRPAAGTLPLVSTLEVAGDGTFRVADLDVRVDLTHADLSQLLIELRGPVRRDGTRARVTLFDGLSGSALTGTVFDDDAPLTIAQTSSPYTGRFRTIGQVLSAFDGQELRGTWDLIVTDRASGGTGTLAGWSLEATPLPQVAPVFNATADPDDPDSSRALNVPIAGGATVTSLLRVPGTLGVFTIADLNVTLDITHDRPSDLAVELIAPDGTVIPLFAGVGGPLSRDFRNTTLDDAAVTAIDQAPSTSFTGIYRLQGAAALAALNGRPVQGDWQLRVTDAGGTGGTLNSWSLTATPENPAAAAARTFRVSFPTQRIGGTYAVTLGSDIQSRNGERLDMDTDAGVDLLRGTAAAAPTVPVAFNSADAPKALVNGATTLSILPVPDSFLIADLNVRLNITHTLVPDLTIVLIAPDGRRITLAEGVGAVGPISTRRNFTNTVFDDQATTPIQNGAAPFFGTFNPQQPLGVLNGTNTAGTWALEITDASGGGTGTLVGWSLEFQRPVPNTGLGEPVADRAAPAFRVFRMDPGDPLSGAVWTPVGPASITDAPLDAEGARQGYSGRISAIAVDPSDPSGNTVYAGAATGGVWRTNNFLTTDPDGPTWVPLTDFGPTFALNVGSIAVFPRNNDPNQSILLVGTGEAAAQFGFGSTTGANAAGSSTQGVGFLRSLDGGATWELLDSTNNALPFGSRDHAFAVNGGTATFKVVADPTPLPTGEVIVYAALSGPSGGLWRSLDTGTNWELMRAGNATDVVLDYHSRSASTGNLDILYAAFAGEGVFSSPNRGQTLNLMIPVGVPQLRDARVVGNPAVTVTNLPSPNGGFGRITLARPDVLPSSDPNAAVKNILYQGWLYAVVSTTGGTTQGIFLTKDFGQSWTQLQLPTELRPNENRGVARPSSNPDNPDYDAPGSLNFPEPQYTLSLVVDPNNPEVVYLGGTSIGQQSGLIRIDVSRVHDAHALIGYDNSGPDGGALWTNTNNGNAAAVVDVVQDGLPRRITPLGFLDPNQYTNLIRQPDAPFLSTSAILIDNIASFTNDGRGVRWTPFDQILQSEAADLIPSTNVHQALALRDPLTGNTRLLFGTDQGIFSGVDEGDGLLDPGIGTQQSATYSRVGNLQNSQIWQGAAQPTTVAAQLAVLQGMFYGMTQGNGYPTSDPAILDNGRTWWQAFNAGELDGADVATDQQGEGTVYQYKSPGLGDNNFTFTEFFQVNGVPRTFGLIQTGGVADPQWPDYGPIYPGLIPMGRFAVNPLDGDQVVISSDDGRIFGTTNQAVTWAVIGNPEDLNGNYAPAVAFGAPDPAAPGGVGNLGNFIYAGTVATTAAPGQIFVTRTGGGSAANAWQNISAGLDGSSVAAIVTDPDRGSHEAYAVTLNGVYYTPDSLTTPWRNITGNLFSIQQAAFGDLDVAAGKLSFLTSIKADWRYAIPEVFGDPDSPTHPALYVSGDAGVYRSLDNGGTWELFPTTADGAPVAGGYLPSVAVTDLDMALGRIDPTNGRPIVDDTSPNVLLASTFGRGAFAIRLAPQVLPGSLAFAPGSDSGASATDRVTNVIRPTLEGLSAQTAFGSVITVNLIDLTDPANPVIIGTGTTDSSGEFSIRVIAGHFLADGTTDGPKVIGVQAIDQAGTRGNVVLFEFVLDTTRPLAPGMPDLQPGSDSGLSDSDNITNNTSLLFDIATGEPATTVLSLIRNGVAIASRNVNDLSPTTTIPDDGPLADGVYRYRARQVDLAGNVSDDGPELTVTVDTVAPNRPAAPVLHPEDDTGAPGDNITANRQPRFNGTADGAGTVELLDAAGNVLARLVVGGGPFTIRPDQPLSPDGAYAVRFRAFDVAGNESAPSLPLTVTIDATAPDVPAPTLDLVAADDSGLVGDRITNNRRPQFEGDAAAGQFVDLILISPGGERVLATGIAGANNRYLLRPTVGNELPEGVVRLQTRVRDAAGNEARSNTLDVTIDTTAPTGGTTLRLRPQDDTLRPGDNITTRRRPVFEGTVPPRADGTPDAGAVVELIDLATGVALISGTTDAQGNFALVLPSNLNNGTITLQARVRDVAGNQGAPSAPLTVRIVTARDDYDGDGRADAAVYRSTTSPGLWSIIPSGGSGRILATLGEAGDLPISGDFDGDGRADLAVWRPSTSTFIIQQSTLGLRVQQFGWAGVDRPAVGDYDGDGRTDIAIYSPVGGYIAALRSRDGGIIQPMNPANPVSTSSVAADYDGDGKDDFALFDQFTAQWTILRSSDGRFLSNPLPGANPTTPVQFGAPSFFVRDPDVAIPGDFDGNGVADLAVFRQFRAEWLVWYMDANGLMTRTNASGALVPVQSATQFGADIIWLPPGTRPDVPTPDDYDGDGTTDLSVYRQETGQYLSRLSGGNIQRDPATGLPPIPLAPPLLGDLPVQSPYGYRISGGRIMHLLGGDTIASRGVAAGASLVESPATATDFGRTALALATGTTPTAPPAQAEADPAAAVSRPEGPTAIRERLLQFRRDRLAALRARLAGRRS